MILEVAEYKMIVAGSHKIAEKVNDLIKEGWQPYGSPMLTDGCTGQAMVKLKEMRE